MLTQTKQQKQFINKVSERLVEIFLQPLYQTSQEKNFYVHVGLLAEIVDWSWEFFHLYHSEPCYNNIFQMRRKPHFDGDRFDEQLIAFGQRKFEKFCVDHCDYPVLMLENYIALQS